MEPQLHLDEMVVDAVEAGSTASRQLGRIDSSVTRQLDESIASLHVLSQGSANAVAGALETFKVFKPEIARLDAKADELAHGIEELHPHIHSLRVRFCIAHATWHGPHGILHLHSLSCRRQTSTPMLTQRPPA